MAVALSTGAMAEGMCGAIADLDKGADQSMLLTAYAENAAGCRTSLNTEGKRAVHCMWTFDYRAGAATAAFTALLEQLETCTPATTTQDQGVNHPDSYDLRLFRIKGQQVGISLKDKGALQQTLVFFTVSLD